MAIPTHRKSYPLTDYIKITRQGASESGEPFVRLEINVERRDLLLVPAKFATIFAAGCVA